MRLFVFAAALYLLAPGHPDVILAGLPLGQTGTCSCSYCWSARGRGPVMRLATHPWPLLTALVRRHRGQVRDRLAGAAIGVVGELLRQRSADAAGAVIARFPGSRRDADRSPAVVRGHRVPGPLLQRLPVSISDSGAKSPSRFPCGGAAMFRAPSRTTLTAREPGIAGHRRSTAHAPRVSPITIEPGRTSSKSGIENPATPTPCCACCRSMPTARHANGVAAKSRRSSSPLSRRAFARWLVAPAWLVHAFVLGLVFLGAGSSRRRRRPGRRGAALARQPARAVCTIGWRPSCCWS